MHKYPEYTFTAHEDKKPKDHTGTMVGGLFGFVSVGFLIGLALLAGRNWLLLS